MSNDGSIGAAAKLSLLREIKVLLPDAEFSFEHPWLWDICYDVLFENNCNCYSEFTQNPCWLRAWVTGTLPASQDDQWKLRISIEERVKTWAPTELSWCGCQECKDSLDVNIYIFEKKS